MIQINQLTEQTVFVERPLGVLHASGSHRLDLIDRMSTQKVKDLAPGQGAATILTTEIGRIIDRLFLYAEPENTITILTGENFNDGIGRYLMSFVFFNDDFHLQDRTSTTKVFGLYGAKAAEVAASLGAPLTAETPMHHWVAGDGFSAHVTDPIAGGGLFLIVPADRVDALKDKLTDAGAQEISAETYDALRIQAGLPRLGTELTNDYIPLEANLWDDVSFNKGCYTGQEIIARMESRGKLAKKLVQLKADQPLAAGEAIMVDGKSVGSITSAAGQIGLGYVKTSALNSGSVLKVGDAVLEPIE